MRYKVRYLPQFNRDIVGIANALAQYPSKAGRIFQEMERKIERIEENPLIWPTYHANPKYRRMNLESHALFYTVDEDRQEVGIYRVIYAKRNISKLLDE